MNPEQKNQVYDADREAALRLMEDIPDVAPVKKGFAVTVISLFVAFLLLPTLVWGVLNLAAPNLAEQINFDTGENRALAAFPEKFDPATFTADVEAWYNDHLPFRSVLYKTQETLDNKLEAPYTNTLRPALIQLFHGNTPTPTPSVPDGTIEDIFNNTETESVHTETETLPHFLETEESETGVSTCRHVLSDTPVVIEPATCTEYGISGYPCTKCDYIGKKAYTAKAKHEYVSDVEKPPRECGTKYVENLTCSGCGDVQVKNRIKQHVAGKKEEIVEPSFESYGYTLVRCRDCKGTFRADLKNKLYDTSYCPPIYHTDGALEGRSKWLFYRLNNSEAYYDGSNIMTTAQLEEYASVMQQLNDLCKDLGKTFQISIWPNKEQVYSEYMPTITIANEYKRVPRLVDYMHENTDVKIIYPIKELMEAKPYWDMYFKYDTHWNNAGAFIGHQAMLESLGLETTSMINLPVRELHSYDYDYGSIVYDSNSSLLYGPKADLISIAKVNGSQYPGNFNYVVTYRPEVTVKMISGNNGAEDTSHSTSDGPNDVNFVLLADSYRVMALDYLRRDFTDCFMTHRSHTMDPDVQEAIKNADIIVISAVERLESDILATAKKVYTILSQMKE